MNKPTYLNQQQKQTLTFVIGAAQFIEQALEKDAKIPADALADLRRARTFSWKGAIGWLKHVDEKTQRSILNMIKDLDIGLISKSDAKKWNEERVRYIGGQEYAERLAETTMEAVCRKCDGSPATSPDGCPIREALIHYAIPVWNESDPVCEYRGAGDVD